ncbi:MAG: phosphoglycerate kinase [Bacteroidales bacterium]|nr:phosphoglycerate kinase [Bacteroidales bacterium]
MTNIDQVNFSGKRVIVRVDFNVPLDDNFNITDDTRMRAAMPTLKKVLNDNGKLIIMSHLGRPKKNPDPKYSVKPLLKHLEELIGKPVIFVDDCMKAAEPVNAMKPGEVMLLENLRFYAEEEGKPRGVEKGEPGYDEAKKEVKAAQKEFTKTLASYADYYINDAFGTAHRAHASTALIADYFDADHKMYGYLMGKEVAAVDKVMNDIKHPFTAIMGGSKVSTKIDIIENLLTKVDNLILCGGMTYTFKKALGGKIGNSICEDDKLDLALDIIAKAKEKGVNLVLSIDTVAGNAFSNDADTQIVDPMNIPDGWEGMDIGPKTREMFAKVIKGSKTILWNGPCGVFEFDKFAEGSKAIAMAIAEATKNGAFSLIGGGDSVACINKFNLADQVSYVSTGGGALLEAIEGKELPGIAAIRK